MAGYRTVFLAVFIWLWLLVHWKSQFVHLSIIIKSEAITEKQIRGSWGLFLSRNWSTNLSHMRSFYITLVGYILSWLKLWYGYWTVINIMINFRIFQDYIQLSNVHNFVYTFILFKWWDHLTVCFEKRTKALSSEVLRHLLPIFLFTHEV